jgi:hypothetical protein
MSKVIKARSEILYQLCQQIGSALPARRTEARLILLIVFLRGTPAALGILFALPCFRS